MFRKSLSLVLAVLMLAGALLCAPVIANAETSGDFEYTVLDDNTISITKYNGSLPIVKIPAKIAEKKVSEIGNYSFRYNSLLISFNSLIL